MSERVWCNGDLLDTDELPVSAFDRGLTQGLGLFETILAVDAHPVFLEKHLARHAAGCERLGWLAPEIEEAAAAIGEVLAANGLIRGCARVRLYQTGGVGALNDLQKGERWLSVVTATPAPEPPRSVSVTFSKWPRNERSALTGLKCASYAENLLALADARRQGFDEVYFLNTRGVVCEAATANLFVVKDGKIVTPPLSDGCLAGITRAWVIEEAARIGMSSEEGTVTRNDLLEADEVFLTSATRGPVPVSRLDGREYRVPEIGRRFAKLWEAAVLRKDDL